MRIIIGCLDNYIHEEMSADKISNFDNGNSGSDVDSSGLWLPSAKESLEFASKLLRRKIPQAGHLMTPRRLWIQTVPTAECDVVMIFSTGTSDNILMWFLSKLKSAGGMGLNVHVRRHTPSDSYQFYLTACFNLLLKCAEELHLPKRVIPEYGGGLKEFIQTEAAIFQDIENKETFFTMPERQWMVLRLLETLRAHAGDFIGDLELVDGQAIVPKCLSEGIITQIFPLHDVPALNNLRVNWVRAFCCKQPINDVCDYFGAKIAMYFAWLGHYTSALIVPAIVGFIFYIGFGRSDQSSEDIGFVLFSFFNVIWFSVYIEAWKRYSAELAYKWGTLDQRDELLMVPRPLFTGTLEISPVTSRLEPTYPSWRRNVFRYFVSVPVIAMCITIVFITMILIFRIQDWWDKKIEENKYPFFFTFLPKILSGIVISIMDEIYFKVAYWLNDKENYRLDTKYENNLIIKVSMFQFANSFISLFYIAFYLQDQERLKVQLAVLLITRQVICNIKESVFPYLIEQFRLAKMSFEMFGALSPTDAKADAKKDDDFQQKSPKNTNRVIPQAELESTLFKFEGTFSEHLEMFIQLGYVVLFSSAFPLAALLALLNNLVEIRSDAFKLCFVYQRPFIQRVANIGMWQNIMEVMGFIAVLVNCALIALSGQVHRTFPDMSKTQTILLIVALEHVMLMIRFLISCAIPDLPGWVATEMAKMEFARREALNRVSSRTATPPSYIPSNQLNAAMSVGRFAVSTSEDIETKPGNSGINTLEYSKPNNLYLNRSEYFEPGTVTQVNKKGMIYTMPKLDMIKDELYGQLGVAKEAPITSRKISFRGDLISPVSSYQNTKDWVESSSAHFELLETESNVKVSPSVVKNLHLQKDVMCSDPDLSRSPKYINKIKNDRVNNEKMDFTSSDTSSIAEESGSLTDPVHKTQKLKPTFIKRARSVAMFSLKLKERRAKAALKEAEKQKEKVSPKNDNIRVGGELSCIPIEMLISIDDVNLQRQKMSSTTFGSKPATPTSAPGHV